ncbi:BnaC05g02600D [Brassica napus]|uniref:BnaC05g02600D protein n=1 Tax=Brassica napus TaxID=3708 RepID=A0A078FZQ5_BRANA|nr:BnaC05g02600D [Brassica napus]
MEGDTPDAKKNEDQLMNVNNDVSPSSLNSISKLLQKKDGRCLAVLSSGKYLQIFKNSPKVSCSDEFSTSSPSHFLRKPGADSIAADQSRKVISLPKPMERLVLFSSWTIKKMFM